MRTHHRLKVDLTLLGPILTRGGQSAPPGIDAPLARDAFGRPMLPFSLVKGKVVDALLDLPDNPLKKYQKEWLGEGSGEGRWEPERGRLRFSDFIAPKETQREGHDGVIERIEIDRETGATAGRMLAMLEAPFGYGEDVAFAGTVEFIGTADEANAIRDALTFAMQFVPAYGSNRTVGFGRTKSVEVQIDPPAATATGAPAGGAVLPVRLAFDRPLCLVGRKHSRNHFESLDCVPGSVLKGATARLLLELAGLTSKFVEGIPPKECAFPHVWAHLAAIRFGEARPMLASATTRPVVPPLSTVMVETDRRDVAMCVEPRPIGGRAPAFAPDWKYEQELQVREEFGLTELPRERRTRTAIDADKGRAADQQLFSYGLVLPKTQTKRFVWETAIGLSDVPDADRDAVRSELAKLYAFGLPNIGKTRAVAAVEWLSKATPLAIPEEPATGETHVIALQTDFLMTDPDVLGTDPTKLEEAYRQFWHEASDGAFNLVRFFARQSLHGGYLRKRHASNRSYEPYLLTDRGSTFVLKAVGQGAPALLAAWRAGGLPLPAWAKKRYADDAKPLWQTCPFLPEVGFGEVAIDLSCHSQGLS